MYLKNNIKEGSLGKPTWGRHDHKYSLVASCDEWDYFKQLQTTQTWRGLKKPNRLLFYFSYSNSA